MQVTVHNIYWMLNKTADIWLIWDTAERNPKSKLSSVRTSNNYSRHIVVDQDKYKDPLYVDTRKAIRIRDITLITIWTK